MTAAAKKILTALVIASLAAMTSGWLLEVHIKNCHHHRQSSHCEQEHQHGRHQHSDADECLLCYQLLGTKSLIPGPATTCAPDQIGYIQPRCRQAATVAAECRHCPRGPPLRLFS